MSLPLPLIINTDGGATQSLQKVIDTNINDNTNQDISAKDVRDTLSDITKGTYGYKTIWSGYVQIDNRDAANGNSRGEWWIWQNYYDPNYFIPDNPYGTATYGRRYQTINNGTGVTDGDYKAVTTSNFNGEGYGLTFNVKYSGGGIEYLEVVNQGWNYFSRTNTVHDGGNGAENDEIVWLNIPNSGSRPQVRINLRNTLRVEDWTFENSIRFGNGWAYNKLWVTLFDGQLRFQKLRNVLPVWTDTLGKDRSLEKSLSRIDWPDSSTWFMSNAYSNPNSQTDFYLAQQYESGASGGSNILRGHLELKVPIV
jgi:hypothetical protein